MKIALAVVLFASCCLAQDARVIPLSDSDAAQVKSLYQQKADIEKKIHDINNHIQAVYTHPCDGKTQLCSWDPIWLGGFTYSNDFKYIVPKDPQTQFLYFYDGGKLQLDPTPSCKPSKFSNRTISF